MDTTTENNPRKSSNKMPVGIVLGIGIGTALGAANGDVGTGAAYGVPAGGRHRRSAELAGRAVRRASNCLRVQR